MSMSGIAVSCECDKQHQKQVVTPKNVQWTIYRIADKPMCMDQQQQEQAPRPKKKQQEVIVDSTEPRQFSAEDAKPLEKEAVIERSKEIWLQFVSQLPEDESRYAVFDYVLPTKSGAYNDKFRFISWSPDCQKVQTKMIYSSTKETVMKRLGIVQKDIFLCGRCTEDLESAFKVLMTDA